MTTAHAVYSLLQIVHNVGGALVLGAPLVWLWYEPPSGRTRNVMWFLVLLWGLQGITGGSFGLASLVFYGGLPEFTRIGVISLAVKISCVILALLVCGWHLYKRHEKVRKSEWIMLVTLAAVSQIAAAALRWNT